MSRSLKHQVLLWISVATVCSTSADSSAETSVVESLIEQRQRYVVMQQWDLSCGAAALATILNYQHGDRVSEREIAVAMMGREEYIANPDLVNVRQGFSLLDMKQFVDARGYNGIGLGQLTVENLTDYAPIIVPIAVQGYQHFVVFRGLQGNRVLLADPAYGSRTMTLGRFERSWLFLPELGHIGFQVKRRDGLTPPNRLAPRAEDFVSIR